MTVIVGSMIVSQPDLGALVAGLADLAATICKEHQATVLGARYTLDHAMAAGDALIKAKAALGQHEAWLPWLKRVEQQGGPSVRMAQNYKRLATKRTIMTAANAKQVSHLTIRSALDLVKKSSGSPRPPHSPSLSQSSSRPPSRPQPDKPQAVTRHEAAAGWASWSADDRQRFIDGIGPHDLAAAIPASWGMRLVPVGESGLRTGTGQIAVLRAEIEQRDITIRRLHRQLGTRPGGVFGIAETSLVDGTEFER